MPGTVDFRKSAKELRAALANRQTRKLSYAIPGLWSVEKNGGGRGIVRVDPATFFLSALEKIARTPPARVVKGAGGSWTREAVIYNLFVRTTCAFDHNRNGKLDLPLNDAGWRETGTFLKAIALLPYIKSLGATVLHLLPITAIGADGNKGTLGSPYAIRNPYLLDENLSEPNAGIGVEEEFRLFVAAAHRLGMRVVVEFVFRTSAKDGDWVREHPDWFYWIKASIPDRKPGSAAESEYGSPIFLPEELKKILSAVEEKNFHDLIPPHAEYREMFTPSPSPEAVRMEGGRYIGTLPDGTRVRIPGAFADWPPDDSQPPWGDVTYLKLYCHPDFNYIAYNTLRMYDDRLATAANVNQPLWEMIEDIIPHYQRDFGIDGVMIDMGHALPMELKQEMIRRARSNDPDFAFWDENFSVTPRSVEEGYNAVIGYQWSDQHHPEKFRNLLKRFAGEGYPLPFFATPESHNTPRAAARPGGMTYARYAWVIGNFIPAIPFIHSGMELGETYPINTGLDFTKAELLQLPSDKLPLFSEYAYDWSNRHEFTELVRRVSAIRQRYRSLIVNPDRDTFHWIEMGETPVIAFLRHARGSRTKLLIVANADMSKPQRFVCAADTSKRVVKDLIAGKSCPVRNKKIAGRLAAGQVLVFEL